VNASVAILPLNSSCAVLSYQERAISSGLNRTVCIPRVRSHIVDFEVLLDPMFDQ
jgi:hypothetical protein